VFKYYAVWWGKSSNFQLPDSFEGRLNPHCYCAISGIA
jgi:hypothetical protein